MRKCPNCGLFINNEQDKYCSKCGTKLHEDFKETQKLLWGDDLVSKPSKDVSNINNDDENNQIQTSSLYDSSSIKEVVNTKIDLNTEKATKETQTPQAKQRMFAHPFSYSGRIGRREYALTLYWQFPLCLVVFLIVLGLNNMYFFFLLILNLWITYAQGTKRCHDIGHSGWWQFIPFYAIWMIFQVGDYYNNQYGASLCHRPSNEKEKENDKKLAVSICVILLAAIIALVIPCASTGFVNRQVSDITGQWYLSDTTRILITISITAFTYGISYILICFSTFRKSILFNVASLILTFFWSAFIGVLLMP